VLAYVALDEQGKKQFSQTATLQMVSYQLGITANSCRSILRLGLRRLSRSGKSWWSGWRVDVLG